MLRQVPPHLWAALLLRAWWGRKWGEAGTKTAAGSGDSAARHRIQRGFIQISQSHLLDFELLGLFHFHG